MEAVLRTLGFESEKEFHQMVADVDLSTPTKLAAFKKWQHEDGTKVGLLKLKEQGVNKPKLQMQLDVGDGIFIRRHKNVPVESRCPICEKEEKEQKKMFELIRSASQLKDGDILYLEKENEYQTMHPMMKNIVLVFANDDFNPDYLMVKDYGGYEHDPLKGTYEVESLFAKWTKIVRIDNIYSEEWRLRMPRY